MRSSWNMPNGICVAILIRGNYTNINNLKITKLILLFSVLHTYTIDKHKI